MTIYNIISIILCKAERAKYFKPTQVAQSTECPLRGTGGQEFDPRLRHTKVVKNGASCSSLGTQNYGVDLGLVELGLVDPVSG